MQLKKTWQKHNNALFLRDISTNQDHLENVIYTVEFHPEQGLYLQQQGDKFEFDFKIYGMESDFMRRVLKTYKGTTGNLGVLLNGVKGTGKTITAELLANQLDQPIILVNYPHGGLNTFLASIQQDVTILIDEYEKVYKGNIGDGGWDEDEENVSKGDSSLLSLMDGTYKTSYRKVFLLTTNRTWVNENMLNRPGRIRYLKNFNDLEHAQIIEIVDDCLTATAHRQVILDYLKPLKLITVDIVKSIVSEVNIHDESPFVCCKDFNLEFKDDVYNIIKLPKSPAGKEVIMDEDVPGATVFAFLARVKSMPRHAALNTDNLYLQTASEKHDFAKSHFRMYDANEGNINKAFTIRFEKKKSYHQSFMF